MGTQGRGAPAVRPLTAAASESRDCGRTVPRGRLGQWAQDSRLQGDRQSGGGHSTRKEERPLAAGSGSRPREGLRICFVPPPGRPWLSPCGVSCCHGDPAVTDPPPLAPTGHSQVRTAALCSPSSPGGPCLSPSPPPCCGVSRVSPRDSGPLFRAGAGPCELVCGREESTSSVEEGAGAPAARGVLVGTPEHVPGF